MRTKWLSAFAAITTISSASFADTVVDNRVLQAKMVAEDLGAAREAAVPSEVKTYLQKTATSAPRELPRTDFFKRTLGCQVQNANLAADGPVSRVAVYVKCPAKRDFDAYKSYQFVFEGVALKGIVLVDFPMLFRKTNG